MSICGSSSCCTLDESFRQQSLVQLSHETGLSLPETKALLDRFLKIAPTSYMTYEGFRSSLGLLGAMEDQYICRRMFSAFDEDSDGRLSFAEFLQNLATMLRGSDEEKLELSFRFFDEDETGQVKFDTFRNILWSLRGISRSLTGRMAKYSEDQLKNIFLKISNGKADGFNLAQFKTACRGNEEFLEAVGLKANASEGSLADRSLEKLKNELLGVITDRESSESHLHGLQVEIERLFKKVERAIAPIDGSFDFKPPVRQAKEAFNGVESEGSVRSLTPSEIAPVVQQGPGRGPSRVILGPKHGKAVHFGHENWNMVLNMMIGVRLGVGRTELEYNREITSSDFHFKDKISILPSLTSILDSRLSKRITAMRFVDYAPLVFRSLREKSGITGERYLKSIGPEQLFGNLLLGNLSSLAELTSEGKSGAFFYFTADNQYLIKTVTTKEKTLLKALLPAYYKYIRENPDSLIVRFYGLHALREKRDDSKKIDKLYFVVMGNLFATSSVDRRYDLKGSWVQREAESGSSTMKDNEFRKSDDRVEVNEAFKSRLMAQIKQDTEFLAGCNILDYSLLLGVSDVVSPPAEKETGSSLSRVGNRDGSKLFLFGIIDVLTEWDTKKRTERMWKSLYQDPRGISCMPPEEYAERFLKFLAEEVLR